MPGLKMLRDVLTAFVPQHVYWNFRAKWRPMHAIVGTDDAQRHLESGTECVELMEHLGVLAGCRVSLGIGSGGGRIEHWLASRVKACVGVDISVGMARLARGNVPATNALFVVGSGTDLAAFRSGAIDLVYSFIVFQHIGDAKVRRYFAETARVLSPGGRFVFQAAVAHGKRSMPFRERHPYTIRWRTSEQVCEWLEASGLTVQRLLRNDWSEVKRDEAAALPEESMIFVAVKQRERSGERG